MPITQHSGAWWHTGKLTHGKEETRERRQTQLRISPQGEKGLDQNSIDRASGKMSHCDLLKASSHLLMTRCSQAGLSLANFFAFLNYRLLWEQTTFLPVRLKLFISFLLLQIAVSEDKTH